MEIKKLIPTGYLLDYLNLLAQQISLPLPTSVGPTNLAIYFFPSSFLLPHALAPDAAACVSTRTRRQHLLPPAACLLPNGVDTGPFPVALPLSSALPRPCYSTTHLRCSRRRPCLASDLGRQVAPAPTVVTSDSPSSPFQWRSASGKSRPICFPREGIDGRVLLWQ